jgi:hypothetical protein
MYSTSDGTSLSAGMTLAIVSGIIIYTQQSQLLAPYICPEPIFWGVKQMSNKVPVHANFVCHSKHAV